MVQIESGQIKRFNLPKVGTLKDGSTVSGYHLLDEETLKDEGWLPLEDIQPEYNVETQYLANDGYEILEDKVIKKYRIEEIPELQEPEPSEIDLLKNEIEELKTTIDTMLGV
jgi:hypothetical protein